LGDTQYVDKDTFLRPSRGKMEENALPVNKGFPFPKITSPDRPIYYPNESNGFLINRV